MVSRRNAIATMVALGAATISKPSWAVDQLTLGRPGGVLEDPVSAGPMTKEAFEELFLMVPERPWVQILRTFGNPVLEGHFSIRAGVGGATLCMAMWDIGDRVLGIGQFSGESRTALWKVAEAALGRKPDISIGQASHVYESDHMEAAHWCLDPATAARIGKDIEALSVQSRKWTVPSKDIARAIEPLTRGLLPPIGKNPSHVLWHEPDPEISGATVISKPYRLGDGNPGIDRAISSAIRGRRMLCPIDKESALTMISKNGGPSLIPIRTPDQKSLGYIRILTM